MNLIFNVDDFKFPYSDLKFPGQASDERILYVTREAMVMLWLRVASVVGVSLILIILGLTLPLTITGLPVEMQLLFLLMGVGFGLLFLTLGGWWMYQLWKKSVFILTNRRLTKFIYTTPWNRYNLSLGLDKIVDTGAYTRGYFQAFWGIGTFTARSGAGNRKEKYFYIENVIRSEDLANYVNKVLHVFNKDSEKLDNFRPFIPDLKGERRKKFMERFPEFWS